MEDEFVKERDQALLSLDQAKIRAYAAKWEVELPADEDVFWAAVHKARTAAKGLPIEARRLSQRWLTERKLQSADDGDL